MPSLPCARLVALAAALAMLGVLPGSAAARTAGDEAYPGFDLTAALAALETGQLYRAPGAPAVFDESRVLPILGPEVRILLAPYMPLDFGSGPLYDAVLDPLHSWAGERELDLVLVVGVGVQTLRAGSFGPSTLDGVRARLAHRDVTTDLVLALENLRSGLEHLDDPRPRPVPPDPAERDAVLAGLASSRVHGAFADGPWLDAALPGGNVRIAALPALGLGAPDPDLLPVLRAAFPDDVVVVLRDRWIEAAGPDAETVSARDYILGRYDDFLARRQVEPRAIARLFLERLELLRSGEPFGRPQPEPVRADEVARRWVPWVFGGAAVVLGGGSLLLAGLRSRRRAEATAVQARRERALAVAELAELDAELLETAPAAAGDGPQESDRTRRLRADAAERIATAHHLLELAREPEEVRAARDAVARARTLAQRARAGR